MSKDRNHTNCTKLEKDTSNLKWTDAFIENTEKLEYSKYSSADSIKITRCGTCDNYQMLMAYVTQFTSGGFWLSEGVMYIVTNGVDSDPDATYEDATTFIKNYKEITCQELN